MKRRMFALGLALLTNAVLSAPALAADDDAAKMLEMLLGGMPDDIEARLAEAEKHPLGSPDNPIRVDEPKGEVDYLNDLVCENGRRPEFDRVGSTGQGVFGHIVDLYTVTCDGSAPAHTEITMDMYFPGYVERRAPPGFKINR